MANVPMKRPIDEALAKIERDIELSQYCAVLPFLKKKHQDMLKAKENGAKYYLY